MLHPLFGRVGGEKNKNKCRCRNNHVGGGGGVGIISMLTRKIRNQANMKISSAPNKQEKSILELSREKSAHWMKEQHINQQQQVEIPNG